MAIDLDVHGNTKPLEAAVQAAVNRIRRKPIKITVDDKGATQPLGNMKRAADEFSKSMEAANARILAFGASMAIINGVADAFKGMVRNLVEVEKSLADINVVMGLTAQNLDKFGDGLFKVAKETGAAFKVAADAATEYARQGLAVEETLKRTRDALVLTRLTGMDSAEAVKSLTAAMNTYGNQIKDTTQLVSKFAAVDVQFAVSAEDFAAAISRTGQAAKSAGVDIDELIGIVTSAQQQTARGGAVIGNALKTIFTKTGRTDTLNQLEGLGIAVRDLEGNTIGAKRILSDLANTFDTLSEAQKAQITQTMGGLFHINILKAVLSDAAKQNGILAKATQISSGATDEAIQKNEQLRQTMSAMATETGLAVKQLSVEIGELMLAPGMEKILNTVKSIAEGASDILGDGESVGSKFANGFLKGVGNVITGPGLVVLTTVFVKLFMTAAKFTSESLKSLIGVTTEAQKQKAIQTSLVTLFGQNAALGKEMLRTDISRTEKEKILLGLLQMQTAEANKLNAISKQLASTLYTRGYGPGLTTGKRRAYGHIPNFADPERSQAARGGYAAGSIRTMNMPGEGEVIYNSAETVKNFAGFKQPAIMPPQSSKAGKNYQKAFGGIHGFDPYAAGGYIPNFALGMSNAKFAAKINRGEMTVDEAVARGYTGSLARTTISKTSDIKTTKSGASVYNLNTLFPQSSKLGVLLGFGPEAATSNQNYRQGYATLSSSGQQKLQKKTGKSHKDLQKSWVNVSLPTKALYEISDRDVDSFEGLLGKSTLEKNLYSHVGRGFDKFSHSIGKRIFGKNVGKAGLNVLRNHMDGSTFGNLIESAIRGSLDNKPVDDKGAAFDFVGENAKNLSKFMGVSGLTAIELKYATATAAGKKGKLPLKVLNHIAASGYIPNFANPLSDAIGREKAAGVPVSQIRVGSHGALMDRDNPLGLGVTNTYDEPNGLRDVFGANGFVPNYKKGFLAKAGKKMSKMNSGYGALALGMGSGFIDNPEVSAAMSGASTGALLGQAAMPLMLASGILAPLAPFAPAIGGAIGAVVGWTTATEDSTKALQDSRDAIQGFTQTGLGILGEKLDPSQQLNGKTLLETFESVPLHMGIAMQEVRESMKGFKGTTQEKIAEEKRLRSKIPYASREDLDRQKKSVLVSLMMGRENEVFRGREKLEKIGLKQETATGLEVMEAIKAASPEQIQKFFNDIKIQLQERAKAETDQTKAVILQLNTQKAIVDAQYASKMQQLEINAKYSSIVDSLTLQERVIGSSITEQQRANFTYTKAIQNAAKKYETGKETAEFGFRKSVLDFAKGGNVIAQLKTSLASGKSIDSGKINLNEELSNLTNQELSDAIAKLDLTDAEKLSLEQIVQARKRNLELLEKEKQIAEQRAKTEKYINDRLAKRNDIISKSKINLESRSSALSHTQTMRGLGMEVSGARRKADFGGGHKTHRQQADFALNESKINAQLKIRELQENNLLEIQRKKIDLKKLELEQEEMLDLYKKKEFEGGLNKDEETYYKGLAKDEEIRLETMKLITQEIDQQKEKTQAQIANTEKLLEIEKQISEENLKRAERLEAIQFAKTKAQYQDKISSDEFEVDQAQLRLSRGPGYISDFQRRRNALSDRSAREERGFTLMEEDARLEISQLKEEGGYEKLMSEQSRYNELYSKLGEGKLFGKEMQEFSGLKDTLESRMEALKKIEEQSQMINSAKDSEIEKTRTLLDLEKQILEQEIAYKTGPGAFGNGLSEGFTKMREQTELLDFELAQRIPGAFADGLANAFSEALSGAKSLDDALKDSAIAFLQMIQKAMMQKAAMNIVGMLPFSSGGNVRKYNNGGSVPAMVSNGEYVMGRDAVNRYGGSFMHSLNAGGNIPAYNNGGKLEGFQFKSGKAYQNKKMSGDFYGRKDHIGLLADSQSLESALSEKERAEAEAVQKAFAEAAEDNAAIMSVIQLVAGAAVSGLVSHFSGKFGAGKNAAKLSKAGIPDKSLGWLKSQGMTGDTATELLLSGSNMSHPNYQASRTILNDLSGGNATYLTGLPRREYFGGPIRNYASGGYISGKSGIDQIPAMLSEGEYVIRASSARQIGKPMLDRINSGKFNDGGPVDKSGVSSTEESSGNTNNINISINIEGSNVKDQSGAGSLQGEGIAAGSNEKEGVKAFSEKIKQQIVSVIVEEQRPGGLLSK